MDDGNDDRDLHLEAVHEDQLVAGNSPNGVNSERVDAVLLGLDHLLARSVPDDGVAAPEDVEIHPEEVVVDPAAVEGEEAHH